MCPTCVSTVDTVVGPCSKRVKYIRVVQLLFPPKVRFIVRQTSVPVCGGGGGGGGKVVVGGYGVPLDTSR